MSGEWSRPWITACGADGCLLHSSVCCHPQDAKEEEEKKAAEEKRKAEEKAAAEKKEAAGEDKVCVWVCGAVFVVGWSSQGRSAGRADGGTETSEAPLLGPARRGWVNHCSKQGAELPRCARSLFLSLQLAALVATIFDAPLLAPYASQLAPVRAAQLPLVASFACRQCFHGAKAAVAAGCAAACSAAALGLGSGSAPLAAPSLPTSHRSPVPLSLSFRPAGARLLRGQPHLSAGCPGGPALPPHLRPHPPHRRQGGEGAQPGSGGDGLAQGSGAVGLASPEARGVPRLAAAPNLATMAATCCLSLTPTACSSS